VTTEVSFRLAGGAQPLILVLVSVNRSEAGEFILDTGAGTTLLTTQMAARAGVRATGTKEGAGAAGRIVVQTGHADSLMVGEVTLRDVPVAITDEVERIGAAIGASVQGTLGYAFLQRFRVAIDYRRCRMQFDTSTPGSDPAGVQFRLAHPAKPLILVSARANGKGPYQFAIDTGASTTVISPDLARKLGVLGVPVPRMTGGGGTVQASAGAIDSLTIGDARCEGVAVVIADFLDPLAKAIGTELDGIVGYNFLREFLVSINYPSSVLTLKPERRK
jgi:predicted aspartyl protease